MAAMTPQSARFRRHVVLDEHLPVDHRLGRVYRTGGAVVGAFLIVFGILGITERIGFFSTGGNMVLGLNSDGALSVTSIVVGGLLLGATAVGGNTTSTVDIGAGIAFLLQASPTRLCSTPATTSSRSVCRT